MTSEYMNNLYRDLLSNSPQTVTIPIPSDCLLYTSDAADE